MPCRVPELCSLSAATMTQGDTGWVQPAGPQDAELPACGVLYLPAGQRWQSPHRPRGHEG